MIKKLLFGSLLLVFILFSNNYSQWKEIIFPEKDSWGANKLDAPDESSAAVAIFSSGKSKIYLTNDKGQNWSELIWPNIKSNETVVDLSMIDCLNIWAGTSEGRIINTSDGGKNWSIQYYNNDRTKFIDYVEMFNKNDGVAFGDAASFGYIYSISFVNKNVGWAVGNVLLKTTDTGETWIEQPLPAQDFLGKTIFFVDENNGWIFNSVTNSQVLRTNDGGTTWNSVSQIGFNPSKFYFIDKHTGWLIMNGSFFKSTDGGFSWIAKPISSGYSFISFSFISTSKGWSIVRNSDMEYCVYSTSNGGNNWEIQKTFSSDKPRDIFFIDESNGWMVGYQNDSLNNTAGYFYATTDGGLNWSSKKISTSSLTKLDIPFYDLHNNPRIVTLIATNLKNYFVSTDYGETWNNINIDHQVFTASFIDKNIWFHSGNNRTIYKTNNMGVSWEMKLEKLPSSAVLLRTTNGGGEWISMNDNMIGWGSGDTWRRIDFINMNEGYFLVSSGYPSINSGYLNITTDGGKSWKITAFPRSADIVKFHDVNYGILGRTTSFNGTNMQAAFISRNGGLNIDTFAIKPSSGWGMDVEFLPGKPSNIWYADYNAPYFSADSGKTWAKSDISAEYRLVDLKFVNSKVGWLAADNHIYRTENNAGMLTSVNEQKEIPNSFSLLQNYPNPFNPTTVIKYELPNSGNVMLKIYDLLGREISTLVNEYQNAGSYNVTFNTQLPSGIYFYRLTAGNFSSVRKMIVLK